MHHQNRLMSRHLGKTHRPARVAMAAALLLLPATMVLGQCESCSPEKCEIQKSLPGPIRLLLPPRIYAVPGIEMNVYFDNICLVVNRANYVFDVSASAFVDCVTWQDGRGKGPRKGRHIPCGQRTSSPGRCSA